MAKQAWSMKRHWKQMEHNPAITVSCTSLLHTHTQADTYTHKHTNTFMHSWSVYSLFVSQWRPFADLYRQQRLSNSWWERYVQMPLCLLGSENRSEVGRKPMKEWDSHNQQQASWKRTKSLSCFLMPCLLQARLG